MDNVLETETLAPFNPEWLTRVRQIEEPLLFEPRELPPLGMATSPDAGNEFSGFGTAEEYERGRVR